MQQHLQERPPALAGSFYPGSASAINVLAEQLLAGAAATPLPARVYIAPHAGWIYSGAIAAPVYHALAADAAVRTIAILCPAHRVYTRGMAIPTADTFATPLGSVPVARTLLATLAALPDVQVADAPHRDEHAIEVHLPFLQKLLSQGRSPGRRPGGAAFDLVPVVVGQCAAASVARLIDYLLAEPGVRLIVSTDLSHFDADSVARPHDADTARRIEALATDLDGEDACGAHALNGLMTWLRQQPHRPHIERLALGNSAAASGDTTRVVGYGAWRVVDAA